MVMILSLLITFLFKKVHFIFTVLLCMLIGFVYSVAFELSVLALFVVIFINGAISAIVVGLVKAGYYANRKANNIKQS
ncbi:hypothetical protein K7887_16565 [Sutcliffiella horikoshii]|uniref:hypothetical protein n=1 Tax=Sutcliffiella horikoshii TaxID=79883 RepID=UPI001CC16C71|nr:hypothetical protein [Sutcliffiella horikoshii]UAL46504.1 hypothetical protein K7887_16565 [Sutcliffiella horikoshii]